MRKLALLPLALLVACAAHGDDQVNAPAAAKQNDTLARVHALVGTPSCTEDKQCRTMALGDIYRAERREANTQSGRVSTCTFVTDPGAVCRAGACELRPGQPVAR